MGQYFNAFVKYPEDERVYCPQNAIFLTLNGLESASQITDEIKRGGGYWDHFSGLKLTEHSWMRNDFCNGVIEQIWDHPARVAWVGDYACEDYDFDFRGGYTKRIYEYAWQGRDIEVAFDRMPHVHMAGYLVNHTKGVYLDVAKYVKASIFMPKWGGHEWWCIHPLPLLTCIGNGRGGGDYHGTNMDKVGSWAMDVIEYTLDADRIDNIVKLCADEYKFVED